MPRNEEREVVLPIRARTVELGDGEVVGDRMACCPIAGESTPLEHCRGCERYLEDSSGQRLGELGALTCRVPSSPSTSPATLPASSLDTTCVEEVMGRWVHCVDSELRLDELATLLEQRKLRETPVVDEDGLLVGVVSRRDLLRGEDEDGPWPCRSPSWLGRTVSDVMVTDVQTVTERAPLRAALETMVRYGRQWLPVITQTRLVVGVLSAEDVLRWLLHTSPGRPEAP